MKQPGTLRVHPPLPSDVLASASLTFMLMDFTAPTGLACARLEAWLPTPCGFIHLRVVSLGLLLFSRSVVSDSLRPHAACQASLSFTISWRLLKLTSTAKYWKNVARFSHYVIDVLSSKVMFTEAGRGGAKGI